jgi:hypothetical protein
MTVEAYENFLETAQVLPGDGEDREAYRTRGGSVKQLLAFQRPHHGSHHVLSGGKRRKPLKESICRALETSVLDRDTKKNNFVRVAELTTACGTTIIPVQSSTPTIRGHTQRGPAENGRHEH